MTKEAATKAPRLPNILDYEDYRVFLHDHYLARKAAKRQFSYRFMSARLDVDPGQLAWILKGRLQLPVHATSAAIHLCHLEGREAAYFEELVRLAHARSAGEKARSRERLTALRGVEARELKSEQASYYAEFHHSVLRALAPLEPKFDAEALGKLCIPALSTEIAQRSMALLEHLGLLEQHPEGWALSSPHITAGSDIAPATLRNFHLQAIRQAQSALREISPSSRDISTLTASLEAEDFEAVRGWISELRHQVQSMAQETKTPDRVVQFNMQFFPVAVRPRTPGS